MANSSEATRTNYFRIKDRAAFDLDFKTIQGVEIWDDEDDPLLIGMGAEVDGWPSYRTLDSEDDPDGVEEDIDIVDVVSKHLAEGEVAVFKGSGHDRLRYVSGWATAVDHTGTQISLNLNDIYAMAQKTFGVEPTAAEY